MSTKTILKEFAASLPKDWYGNFGLEKNKSMGSIYLCMNLTKYKVASNSFTISYGIEQYSVIPYIKPDRRYPCFKLFKNTTEEVTTKDNRRIYVNKLIPLGEYEDINEIKGFILL